MDNASRHKPPRRFLWERIGADMQNADWSMGGDEDDEDAIRYDAI